MTKPIERLVSLVWLYAVGLAVPIRAPVGFAKLADEVPNGRAYPHIDVFLRGLHAHTSRSLQSLAHGLSELGVHHVSDMTAGSPVAVYRVATRLSGTRQARSRLAGS